MSVRLVVLATLLALAYGPVQAADPAPTILNTAAEAAGDTGKACLDFGKPLDPGSHVSDFVVLEPASRPGVEATGNQLCLSGLGYATHYTVTIRPGLRFKDGSVTQAAQQSRFDVPDRDPLVAVGGQGWILPRQTSTGVTIQTINVPMVRIRVLRVAERRLAAGSVHPDPAKQSITVGDLQAFLAGTATQIWSGTLKTGAGRNVTVETAFPLAGVIDPAKPGAYIVLAENAALPATKITRADDEPYDYEQAQIEIAGRWVLNTDLGLSSLQGQDGLHVTVRSLASARPLPGVKLQLLSRGQDLLAEATTDSDGGTVFAAGLMRGKLGAAPNMLVARTDAGDVTVQDLKSAAFDLSDRGADGRVVPGPIEAYLYTDRGIYRPGETVHVMALLRSHGLSAVDGTGLTLLVRRPDGVEASRTTQSAQPDAGFHQAIDLSATAAQGDWTIEAFVDPTLPPIGRALISVQDFVPQQLKVTLTGPSTPVSADGHLLGSIDGRFLYGAPAAGLHAEGQVRLERDEHPVAEAKDYSFGIAEELISDPVQPLTLDDANDAGHVAIDAVLKLPPGLASPIRAVLEAGLTEPGGRAVKETVTVPVRTGAVLIGVRKMFRDQVNIGETAAFAIRTFTASGQPTSRSGVAWRLVAENRHWDWWRGETGNGSWTFHFHMIDRDIAHGTVDVPADQPVNLAQKLEWGEYRLIMTDAASGAGSSVRFAVGWGGGDVATDVPDRLEVTTDRPLLASGQTAQVHLRGPFAGLAQVTIESSGRVLETRRLDLPADGATISLTASDAWGPGVHMLATAYRPLTAPSRAHDPVRAVGLAWIGTDPAAHTLGVTIGGTRQTTPRQAVLVPIHVTGAHGQAFVTLAAVDEGILQLTHFVTPDPVGVLMGRTRLALEMRDDYGRLLEGHADVGAMHEGGDEGSLGGAGLAVITTRIVSLFHGPVALDATGNASVSLDLPDFAGELRLMAVAYDHDSAGHAEAALTIRDPVVADVSLPRFLAPDDLAEAGVSMNNTDGPAGDYHLAVAATGAVGVLGAGGVDMHLDQGQRWQSSVSLRGRSVGTGHVRAVLSGPGGLQIQHDWDIAVRSPHPDLVVSRTDPQAPGETYSPAASLLTPFMPGSVRLTIGYSAVGSIDVPGLLQSLYTYPYGCTEQLSSSAFPLLYFDDARLLGRKQGDPAVHARVQTAIATISDRQDAAGQFGLWRVGDSQASVWLNVYALDFLLHARDAGFVVADRVTSSSAAWIEEKLRSGFDDDNSAYKEPVQPTRAYAAYVLARTSRVDPGELRMLTRDLQWHNTLDRILPASVSWRNNVGLASPLSLGQLAGAQSLMGQTADSAESFRLALANLDVKTIPNWWYGAFYYSPLRDDAGLLAVAAETNHPEVSAPLLDQIGNQHLEPDAMNTQEKAWLLAAAHALSKQGGTRSLAVDGAAAQAVTLPFAVSPSMEQITHGTTVLNADTKPVFRTLTLRGSPVEAPPALSQGLKIRRQTFTLTGETMDDSKLRQTDRFIVVLSGSVTEAVYRRAVVADPLPAGLEIESAVTKDDTYPFIGQLTHMAAHEQRDDRFVAAFDVNGQTTSEVNDDTKLPLKTNAFRVAYVVRAVTAGRFVRPETVVEDMYRPQVMARTSAGQMNVAPR